MSGKSSSRIRACISGSRARFSGGAARAGATVFFWVAAPPRGIAGRCVYHNGGASLLHRRWKRAGGPARRASADEGGDALSPYHTGSASLARPHPWAVPSSPRDATTATATVLIFTLPTVA